MATTYELIASNTVGSGGASSVTFSSIPNTYTDLKVVFSLRSDTGGGTESYVQLNSTNFTDIMLRGNGSTATSNTLGILLINASGSTSNVFTNGEIYIPNYTSSTAKSASVDVVTENNATGANAQAVALLWSSVTSAVTSLTITDNYGSWVQYSTAYLYGIKNS